MAYQKIFINRQPRLQADLDHYQNVVSGIGRGLETAYGIYRDDQAKAARDEEMRLRKEDRERLYNQAKTKALLDLQDIKDPEQRAAYAPFIFKAYGIPYPSEDVYGTAPEAPQPGPTGTQPYMGGGAAPPHLEPGEVEQNPYEVGSTPPVMADPRAASLLPAAQARIDREDAAATALGAPPVAPRGPLMGQRIVADLGGQKVTVLDPQRELELREAQRARRLKEVEGLGIPPEDMPLYEAAVGSPDPEVRKAALELLKEKAGLAKEIAKEGREEERWKKHQEITLKGQKEVAAIAAGRRQEEKTGETETKTQLFDLSGKRGVGYARTEEEGKKIRGGQTSANRMLGVLDELKKWIDREGTVVVPGFEADAYSELQNIVGRASGHMTSLFATGTLQEGERKFLQDLLKPKAWQSQEGAKANVDRLRQEVIRGYEEQLRSQGIVPSDEGPAAPVPSASTAPSPHRRTAPNRSRPVTPQERASAKQKFKAIIGGSP